MKVLQNMNILLNTKLDLLNDTVESLKGDVFDLQQRENARLKAQLDQCQKRQEVMITQVQEAVFSAKLAEERSERNEQYYRRNSIKLLFIEESADSFESAEKSEEKAQRVFHDKLGLRYIKPEKHRSSPPSWEESCRQDKAYHREVCVEKDETGCDQEQMKAKNKNKLRP